MGLFELLMRWFHKGPAKRPPAERRPPLRGEDEEDEETAELLAIEII